MVLILVFANVSISVSGVATLMDIFFTTIFAVDFLYRLYTAKSRFGYLGRQFGWADVLSSLSFAMVKTLRVFSLYHTWQLMYNYDRQYLAREFQRSRARSTLLSLLFFIILTLEFGGMTMVAVEHGSPDANIITPAMQSGTPMLPLPPLAMAISIR